MRNNDRLPKPLLAALLGILAVSAMICLLVHENSSNPLPPPAGRAQPQDSSSYQADSSLEPSNPVAATPGLPVVERQLTSASATAPVVAALEGTKGEITIEGKSQALRGSDGLFDRVYFPEKGSVRIAVDLANLELGSEVAITAPNGGNLKRAGGPLHFKATGASESLVLDFDPVLGRGAYTIRIQNKGASQIIDLWAGPPNPLGEPGPAYVQQTSSEIDGSPQ